MNMNHEDILNLIISNKCLVDNEVTVGCDYPCDHKRKFQYEILQVIRYGWEDGKEIPIIEYQHERF